MRLVEELGSFRLTFLTERPLEFLEQLKDRLARELKVEADEGGVSKGSMGERVERKLGFRSELDGVASLSLLANFKYERGTMIAELTFKLIAELEEGLFADFYLKDLYGKVLREAREVMEGLRREVELIASSFGVLA